MDTGRAGFSLAVRIVSAALALEVLSFIAAGPAFAAGPMLFGTVEFRMANEKQKNWLSMLKRNSQHPSFNDMEQRLTRSTTWGGMKRRLEGKPVMDILREVNRFWNAWPYRSDREAYGKTDYWASPHEFIRNSGDCEDYCIVKYFTLKALGIPVDSMRIAVVKETIRGIGHAVLAVYEGGNIYILDNLADNVRSSQRIRNYIPQYSINEKARWVHVRPR